MDLCVPIDHPGGFRFLSVMTGIVSLSITHFFRYSETIPITDSNYEALLEESGNNYRITVHTKKQMTGVLMLAMKWILFNQLIVMLGILCMLFCSS